MRVDAHTQRPERRSRPQSRPKGSIMVTSYLLRQVRCANPITSLALAKPRAASSARSSLRTLIGARGSLKITVPTWTALAPAARNSNASAPVRMPPTPMMGAPGNALRHLPDGAHRDRAHSRTGKAAR